MQSIIEHLETQFGNPATSDDSRISWRTPDFSDWDLTLGKCTYKVHRVFFKAGRGRSEFLCAQMERWSESATQTNLTHLLPKPVWGLFELVLDYVYGGDIVLKEDNVMLFLKIAEVLQMRALGAMCIQFLKVALEEAATIKWDSDRTSNNIKIDEDGSCATKITGLSAWNGAVIAQGAGNISCFAVEVSALPNGNDLMIGFVDGSLYKPHGSNYNTSGFFLYCNGGSLYSLGGSGCNYLNKNITIGDIIEAIYDAGARTISFSVGKPGNMTDFGVAFSDVAASGGLWPCVDFFSSQAAVKLICVTSRQNILSVTKIAQTALQVLPGFENVFSVCLPFLAKNFEKVDMNILSTFPSDALEAILSSPDLKCNSNPKLVSCVLCNYLTVTTEPITTDIFNKLTLHISDVRPEDAIPLLNSACEHGNQDIKKLCLETLEKSFSEISTTILEKIPDHKLFAELMDSDKLSIQHEDQVFDAIEVYTKNQALALEEKRRVWATCRFAFVSSEKLVRASEIKEIPRDMVWLHFAVSKIPAGAKAMHEELVQKYGYRLRHRLGCLRWNSERTSDVIEIYQNGSNAKNVSMHSGWNGAVIAQGTGAISRFTVEVIALPNGNDLMIGFVDGSLYKPQGSNYNESGFFLYCNGGSLYSYCESFARRYMSRSISAGEIVEARFDAMAKTISFSVGKPENMTDYGVAFYDVIATGGLWPCVDFFSCQAAVKLCSVV